MATEFAASPFQRHSLLPHTLNLGWPYGNGVVPVQRPGLNKPCSFQCCTLGTLKPCEQDRAGLWNNGKHPVPLIAPADSHSSPDTWVIQSKTSQPHQPIHDLRCKGKPSLNQPGSNLGQRIIQKN